VLDKRRCLHDRMTAQEQARLTEYRGLGPRLTGGAASVAARISSSRSLSCFSRTNSSFSAFIRSASLAFSAIQRVTSSTFSFCSSRIFISMLENAICSACCSSSSTYDVRTYNRLLSTVYISNRHLTELRFYVPLHTK